MLSQWDLIAIALGVLLAVGGYAWGLALARKLLTMEAYRRLVRMHLRRYMVPMVVSSLLPMGLMPLVPDMVKPLLTIGLLGGGMMLGLWVGARHSQAEKPERLIPDR